MARAVFCVRLQKEAEGLDYLVYPGELGKKIFQNVSKQAWQDWLKHQTMIINEYRLNVAEPAARRMLEEEMQRFFFGDGGSTPEGYVPKHIDDPAGT